MLIVSTTCPKLCPKHMVYTAKISNKLKIDSIQWLNETVNYICLCTQQKHIPVKIFGRVKVCSIVVHKLYIVVK